MNIYENERVCFLRFEIKLKDTLMGLLFVYTFEYLLLHRTQKYNVAMSLVVEILFITYRKKHQSNK